MNVIVAQHLQIGDKVEIVPEEAGLEWQGDPPQYVVGIEWRRDGASYATSETWPPRWDGLRIVGVTDGWQERHLRKIASAIGCYPDPQQLNQAAGVMGYGVPVAQAYFEGYRDHDMYRDSPAQALAAWHDSNTCKSLGKLAPSIWEEGGGLAMQDMDGG